MLSLGKLATGQAGYYLDQAHGTISRARSVSSGVEDYYLDGLEAEGEWAGAGAAILALRGKVGGEPLNRVLAGEHPATGEPLGRLLPARRPGFDLTFSAPKSVSVLFGVGDDAMRAVIKGAHDRAVRGAHGYVERAAAVTRRGAGGAHALAGNGLVAAAFRHRTSRAGDLQLHTHVLVANLTLGADGQWSTLDGRRIYAHAKTAGYLFEARLRAELTRELAVAWGPVRNGIADVDGVPAGVLQAFSRRRAEIDAELERRGASGAGAAQVATLATRRGKDYRVRPEQLVPEWRARATQLGLSPELVRSLGGRARSEPLRPEVLEEIAESLAGAQGLTRRRSTFTRHDVIQAMCEALPASAGLAVDDVERLADAFLRSNRVIVLAVGDARRKSGGHLRLRDGRLVSTVPDERVYSTPELLAKEQAILRRAVDGQETGLGVAANGAVERAIHRRLTIADEQAEMVRRLTRQGDAVAVVVGRAGTGKTFALAAAREAWEVSRYTVIGAALAQRAARVMKDGAGIESETIAGLLARLRRSPTGALPRRAVLVVDEAGMVSTRELAELFEHAERARAKVVLVGDHRQLAEIDAGGAFRALAAHLPAIELTENRRQADAWERDALALLRDGDGDEAMRRYERRGRILTGETADDVRQRLVADWWASRAGDQSLMIALRRVDVADLNGRARALMRASGALGETELVVNGNAFAKGDRVQLRLNSRRLAVANGDRGTITAIDTALGTIDVDLAGRRIRLDADYLQHVGRGGSSLAHGYAITGHSAQGLTCDETFVLVSGEASREWVYTALSRGRVANRLYAIAPEPDERAEIAPTGERMPSARDTLAAAVGRSSAQALASTTGLIASVAADLERASRAREAAERRLADATVERERLEASRPSTIRMRARTRHSQALANAYQREGTAGDMVAARQQDEHDQRNRLEAIRERGARNKLDRVPEPRRRERRRDLGLER